MSKILLQQAKRTTPTIVPVLRWLSSRGNYDQKCTLPVYQVSSKYRHFIEPATAFFCPKVGAVGSSETLVLISRTTWGHHCENLKSHFTIKWHISSIVGHSNKAYCLPCLIYFSDNIMLNFCNLTHIMFKCVYIVYQNADKCLLELCLYSRCILVQSVSAMTWQQMKRKWVSTTF